MLILLGYKRKSAADDISFNPMPRAHRFETGICPPTANVIQSAIQ